MGIQSNLKAKSTLEKILKDPGKLKEDINALDVADKKAKASLKKLLEGKSFAKAKKEFEELQKKSKVELLEAKTEAKKILDDSKVSASKLTCKVNDRLAEVKFREDELSLREKELDSQLLDVKKLSIELTSKEKRLQKDLGEVHSLKAEYKNKINDVKHKLASLI